MPWPGLCHLRIGSVLTLDQEALPLAGSGLALGEGSLTLSQLGLKFERERLGAPK
jgi:hypothetical protein